VFSPTDADTVSWGAGTFTAADGTVYNINAGNTGNMSSRNFIYLDIGVSTVSYLTTTVATSAIGAGRVMVAIAENHTTEATFTTLQGQGGINIDAASIVAGSITANEIAATTITTAKLATDVIDSGKIVAGLLTATNIQAGTLTGRTIQTAATGARVQMFPDANTGLVIYDNQETPAKVFEALVGGDDIGDVTIGDYANNKGLKWDKDAGTFTVRGILNANDVSAGTLTGRTVQTDTGEAGHYERGVLDSSDNALKFYDSSNNNKIEIHASDENYLKIGNIINDDANWLLIGDHWIHMGYKNTQTGSPFQMSRWVTDEWILQAQITYDGNTYFKGDMLNDGDISIGGSKGFYVGSHKVVGARVIDARCDDAINSGDATTDGVIDALRDAMIAHGLIAAS